MWHVLQAVINTWLEWLATTRSVLSLQGEVWGVFCSDSVAFLTALTALDNMAHVFIAKWSTVFPFEKLPYAAQFGCLRLLWFLDKSETCFVWDLVSNLCTLSTDVLLQLVFLPKLGYWQAPVSKTFRWYTALYIHDSSNVWTHFPIQMNGKVCPHLWLVVYVTYVCLYKCLCPSQSHYVTLASALISALSFSKWHSSVALLQRNLISGGKCFICLVFFFFKRFLPCFMQHYEVLLHSQRRLESDIIWWNRFYVCSLIIPK